MARCTKLEKAERINTIIKMLSDGHTRSEILRFCSIEWGLGARGADIYLKEAREEIVKDINLERHEVVAELMHGARTIWKAAARDKQYNNALGAMNLIARLGGLEQSK